MGGSTSRASSSCAVSTLRRCWACRFSRVSPGSSPSATQASWPWRLCGGWAGLQLRPPFPLALLVGGSLRSNQSAHWATDVEPKETFLHRHAGRRAIRLILTMCKLGGARGWAGIPVTTSLFNVAVTAVIGTFVMVRLCSRHGRNMIAIRRGAAARTVGIDALSKMMSHSSAHARVAGGCKPAPQFLRPKMFSMVRSTELTIMVIFGGIGAYQAQCLGRCC